MRMKILLTEGAGLTSRQVATQLDAKGHHVAVPVADDICLARFTRHVRTLHRVPDFGENPLAWLDRVLEIVEAEGIPVIFPTQEQVAVLSHQLTRVVAAGVATAVPPFGALVRVQDKVSALRTLESLGIPQPPTAVVQSVTDTASWTSFPVYVKAPVGTGSTGVRKATNPAELAEAVQHFVDTGSLEDGGVLVQQAMEGTFVMAQCVFDSGVLVAFHANERVQEGASGSASVKVSIDAPGLRSHLQGLGHSLMWHGALSVDAIVVEGTALVIDVNARLVEPGNAMAAGTDMVGALLDVALGRFVELTPPSSPGVRTHQLLMAILGAAQRTGRRRDVLREVTQAFRHKGVYESSTEELCPTRGDRRTVILPIAAFVATVCRPSLWSFFTDGAVSRYALAPAGWRQLRRRPVPLEVSAAAV